MGFNKLISRIKRRQSKCNLKLNCALLSDSVFQCIYAEKDSDDLYDDPGDSCISVVIQEFVDIFFTSLFVFDKMKMFRLKKKKKSLTVDSHHFIFARAASMGISKWESHAAPSLISLCQVDWVIPYDTQETIKCWDKASVSIINGCVHLATEW